MRREGEGGRWNEEEGGMGGERDGGMAKEMRGGGILMFLTRTRHYRMIERVILPRDRPIVGNS